MRVPCASSMQYLGDSGCEYVVFKNDEKTVSEIKAMNPKGVIVSPGPGELHVTADCPPPGEACTPQLQHLYCNRRAQGIRDCSSSCQGAWATDASLWGMHGTSVHWRGIWRCGKCCSGGLRVSIGCEQPCGAVETPSPKSMGCKDLDSVLLAGDIIRAPTGLMHGKTSLVHHTNVGVLEGMDKCVSWACTGKRV